MSLLRISCPGPVGSQIRWAKKSGSQLTFNRFRFYLPLRGSSCVTASKADIVPFLLDRKQKNLIYLKLHLQSTSFAFLLGVKLLVLTFLELLIEMGREDVEKEWTTREDQIAIRRMYCLFSDRLQMEHRKYRKYRQQKRYKLK